MSAKVAYVARTHRGTRARSVRLVGLTGEEAWHAPGGDGEQIQALELASGWIVDRLREGRGSNELARLVLDARGSVCTWLSVPSASPEVVSAIARAGAADDGAERSQSPVEFFGGSALESSVEGLGLSPPTPRPPAITLLPTRRSEPESPPAPTRVGVVTVSDALARVMLDRLDGAGISVEGCCSIWHAMVSAWAPRLAGPVDPLVQSRDDVRAIIAADPDDASILWAWGLGGRLIAGGTARARVARADAATEPGAEGSVAGTDVEGASRTLVLDADDAARLTGEWLAWSAQLGVAPESVVCILPAGPAQGLGPALAERLSEAGVVVESVANEDPIGATLRELARRLDSTPATASLPDAGVALVGLSNRPGRRHRGLYRSIAAAILVASGALGVVAWRLESAAADARAKRAAYQLAWEKVVRELHPEAFDRVDTAGVSPLTAMEDEIARLRRDLEPSERRVEVRPVLEELETISLVVGTAGLRVESLELTSQVGPPGVRLTVVADDQRTLERLAEALARVGGSRISEWRTPQYTTVPTPGGMGPPRFRGTYTGMWDATPGGGAT